MEFKDRIKALRVSKPISAIDLAKALNISESAIRMYESGRAMPSAETMLRLADVFDVPVDYLLGRTDIQEIDVAQILRIEKKIALKALREFYVKLIDLKSQLVFLENEYEKRFGENL